MITVTTHRILKPVFPTPAAPTLPFRLDETFFDRDNGRVKIYDWGTNFKQWFGGMVETVEPSPLQVYALPDEGATDREIVDDLGGEEAARIYMSAFWEQITLQGHGQRGLLPVDGYATVGYAFDRNGVLRTVYVRWNRVGWRFDAIEFPRPGGWFAGGHVVAPRNS